MFAFVASDVSSPNFLETSAVAMVTALLMTSRVPEKSSVGKLAARARAASSLIYGFHSGSFAYFFLSSAIKKITQESYEDTCVILVVVFYEVFVICVLAILASLFFK